MIEEAAKSGPGLSLNHSPLSEEKPHLWSTYLLSTSFLCVYSHFTMEGLG